MHIPETRIDPIFQCRDEQVSDMRLVQFLRNARGSHQRVQIGRKDERVVRMVVIKRAYPKLVTRTKETLMYRVPNRECEISEEMVRTTFSPRLIRTENEFTIGNGLLIGEPERGEQFIAVVQPCICRDRPMTQAMAPWKLLVCRL
jgi:hypothetical protein